MMKTKLELLTLLRENFKDVNEFNFSCNGICDTARVMCMNNKITINERNQILEYLRENRPSHFLHTQHYYSPNQGLMYWWPSNEGYVPRIKYLEHLIEIEKGNEQSTESNR